MMFILRSMTGRIVMSSYETLRATGTTVLLGDSSPLLLPCIRFRDLVVHTAIAVTPVTDVAVSSFGDSILVEVGTHAGFDLAAKGANDLVFNKPINRLLPTHSHRLETNNVKVILITVKYKHTMGDAALGFYRGSVHQDVSLFATVKDYLAVEKGWFSPYLFASGRRPVIPRSMKPDIIFCHGPFLLGDYRVGEILLEESALVITLCAPTPVTVGDTLNQTEPRASKLSLSNLFNKSPSPSPEPMLPSASIPRRMVVLVVGLKPHRRLWTTSARPGESVINYILLDGCPAIVVPVKVGAPLVAWDALTLDKVWKTGRFEGIVNVLFEYLDFCIDWQRFDNPRGAKPVEGTEKTVLSDALALLVTAAIRSGRSRKAKSEVDEDRSGIAFWRIP
ncbi:hypothetical protein BD779DRAFT_1530487 [Infundibulicybe gibba]|nr:hypothetical protein BD779DRAFT_1530487 [Infundibulicybe gibba]